MLHALHINDNNLVLQSISDSDSEILQRSQGYALFEGDSVVFDLDGDKPPVRQCRKTPLQINNRYWQQCAQSAISENAAGMRHAADLIWKHLGVFKEQYSLTELALVVPANYRDTHLQLLLGVAKANQLQTTALISKPAWCARQSGVIAQRLTHVDVQMHQTVISTVLMSGAEVVLDNVKVMADVSLIKVQEALLQSLQSCFIQEDRFDPLHDAETEQQLFDQLPLLMERAIKNQKNNVGVEHNGKLYHAVIEPSQIKSALSPLFEVIDKYNDQPVLVDMNAEFDLQSLELDNVTWISDVELLPIAFAHSADKDGNVVYRTGFPAQQHSSARDLDSKPNIAPISNTESTEESAKEPIKASTANKEEFADNDPQLASHVMLNGLAVAIADAEVVINGTQMTLSKNQGAGNLEQKINAGDLQIINDVGRVKIVANDRLVSPLADGVLTALRML